MALTILLFTQSGCLNCEVMRIFLEAKGITFEERDMSLDTTARAELLETYHSRTAPTVVILTASGAEVIEGFDPDRLDQAWHRTQQIARAHNRILFAATCSSLRPHSFGGSPRLWAVPSSQEG